MRWLTRKARCRLNPVVLAWRRAALVIVDCQRGYCHNSPTDAIGPTPIERGARRLHQRAEPAPTMRASFWRRGARLARRGLAAPSRLGFR
jgi:nicotinamidase-related amidase